VITIIKRILTDLWNQHFLISFFTQIQLRGDPLSQTLVILTFSTDKPNDINDNLPSKKMGVSDTLIAS